MPESASGGRTLRAFWVVLCMMFGAAVARVFENSPPGWLTGGASAVAVLSTGLWMADGQRVRQLQRWLAGSLDGAPPRLSGPLGGLAYRISKALIARDARIAAERRHLEEFLAAIEASPNGVLLLDASDSLQWFNRTAAQHFGLDPARDKLQRVTNLVRAPAFVAHLQAPASPREVVFPSPKGDATLSVLVRPYGESMRLMLSQDITEKERSDAMRRDFVANVSHEIRSPLTTLSGFIESMIDLPLTTSERERALMLMRQQAQRMQALVTDLLALARIEGAPPPESDRWMPADELMRHLASDAAAFDADQHRLSFGGEGVAALACAHSEMLSACWNLVGNALRYTPPGGHIGVSLRLRPDGGAEFRVVDDGPGIAREHLPRLTERFYRVDGSRSRDTGGTGLGLAIVKHVVQRHGGELFISSEPGAGSEFRFVLPAARVKALGAAAAFTTG